MHAEYITVCIAYLYRAFGYLCIVDVGVHYGLGVSYICGSSISLSGHFPFRLAAKKGYVCSLLGMNSSIVQMVKAHYGIATHRW